MKIIKDYCDICGKEMSNSYLPVVLRRTFSINSFDCCETCWNKVFKYIDVLKQESKGEDK